MAASRKDDTPRLLRAAASKLKLDEGLVRSAWEGMLKAVLEEMALKGSANLRDLGRFTLHERKPRTTRNPRTGRMQLIPPGRTVRVSPSREFKDASERKLSVVLGIGDGFREALSALEGAAYTVLTAPGLPEAQALLESRPAGVVLAPSADPAALFGFLRRLKGLPQARLACVLAPALPPGAPLPDFRVLPERWIPPGTSPEALAESVERDLARLSEERGYFQQHLSMELASTSEAVHDCVLFLESRLEEVPLEDDERHKLGAALREAIENGLRHGNKRDASKRLFADLLVDAEKVTFWVRDEGPGFDYEAYLRSAPSGTALEVARANIEQGKTGGLGIRLLHECVDEVRYAPPGNLVTLTKSLSRPASGT